MLKPTKHHKCWRKRPLRTNANSWKCTRRVPWLSAILLRQGQAGEIAKIQLPCMCAYLAAARDPFPSGRRVLAPPIYILRKQREAPAPRKVMPPPRAHYRRKPVYRETVLRYLETEPAFRFCGQDLSSALPQYSSEQFPPLPLLPKSGSAARCLRPRESQRPREGACFRFRHTL